MSQKSSPLQSVESVSKVLTLDTQTHGLFHFDAEGHLLLLDQISIHVILGKPASEA